ncbi:carboxypeptidase-like regulatory domain-containing protein [Myxococcus stipitatus]|uniref:carboxypeptidase-like regulatory domain-containing protein n=1 Tax=Myxococcus stipitatus TaxID=83455 RepID=UPI003144F681
MHCPRYRRLCHLSLRLLVFGCCLFGARALAGATLMGKVTHADSPWDAVEGVSVGAVLEPGHARWAVTDARGEYRLDDLPAGEYLVVFQKQETASSDHREVQLAEGQTLRLDLRLMEGPELAETMEWGWYKTTAPTRFQVNGAFFPELMHQRPARERFVR